MRRLFFIVSIALLFSLGQQGVAVHAISHLAEQHETHNKGEPQHQVCDKCVVYAGLAAAVTSGALWILPAGVLQSLASKLWTAVPRSPSLYYSARAPPLSL